MPPDPRRHEPGGHAGAEGEAATLRSFSMLLGPDALPGGGWTVAEERSWPTGQLDPASGKSRRAQRQTCITAWRKFANAHPSESAWVEVVPYASTEDAGLSLRQVPQFFVGTAPSDEEVVVDEHVVDDRVVPGVHEPWVYEKSSRGPGGDAVARYVAGAVGPVVILVCLTGTPESWAWTDVLALATAQAGQVRSTPDVRR